MVKKEFDPSDLPTAMIILTDGYCTFPDEEAAMGIPVIWNGSGYETPETLAMLEGLVDIYLPDFKYADEALAQRLSGAPDYPAVAARAIGEMARQTGAPVFGENGLLLRGTLVRHLVLPGHRANSMAVLDTLAGLFPDRKQILVSLMNQYTPDFYLAHADATAKDPLRRRLTTFEYESVLSYAADLGFDGYRQDRAAATADYTPRFFGSSDEEAAAGDSPAADS
jgi:putative pyruvate formate lyase activating enzyme